MAAWKCGWCDHKSRFSQVGDSKVQRLAGESQVQVDGAYRCDNCMGMSVVRWRQPLGGRDGIDVDTGTDIERYPQGVEGRDYPDAPAQIAATATEAWNCFSINAYRGALALARAVVESTAKDQGHDKGNLKDKIDKMADAGLIRAGVKDAAHEIRFSGNDVAHGDLARVIDAEEAEELLGIMDDVLEEVYVAPARAQKRRAARQARQAPTTP